MPIQGLTSATDEIFDLARTLLPSLDARIGNLVTGFENVVRGDIVEDDTVYLKLRNLAYEIVSEARPPCTPARINARVEPSCSLDYARRTGGGGVASSDRGKLRVGRRHPCIP